MVKVLVDLKDENNKFVRKYMVIHDISNKDDAVNEIIAKFKENYKVKE